MSGIAELPKQKQFCITRGLFSPRDFYLCQFNFFKGGMLMTLEKSCKFYEDARCILKDGYCDLNCNQTIGDKDIQYNDEVEMLTKWRIEKAEKEIENSGWKLK
jgi:hypothetical protein